MVFGRVPLFALSLICPDSHPGRLTAFASQPSGIGTVLTDFSRRNRLGMVIVCRSFTAYRFQQITPLYVPCTMTNEIP